MRKSGMTRKSRCSKSRPSSSRRRHDRRRGRDVAADLIVIGTHGRRGVNRLLLGSVAESVARVATKPVLLIRENDHCVSVTITYRYVPDRPDRQPTVTTRSSLVLSSKAKPSPAGRYRGAPRLPRLVLGHGGCIVGSCLGDQMYYFLGRRYGHAILARFPVLQPKAHQCSDWSSATTHH